jgi:hypothetical protein
MVKKYLSLLRNKFDSKKANFFILIFALSIIKGYSQYKKIPIDSNYYWKQSSTTNTNTSNCKYNYQIKYKKDTVINARTYNKYSTFGAATGNSVSPCNVDFVRHGYLRQDTINKRVIILDNNFIERPLYNFSKVVGDTMLFYRRDINANITLTVTIRDSIQFTDGVYHKRQYAITTNYGNHFVEGLGSINSGLFGHTVIGYIPYTEVFYCFGKINPFNTLYTGTGWQSQCFLSYTGVEDKFLLNTDIKIYPNPTEDVLNIEFENSKETNFSILNSFGQIVYLSKNLNSKQEIDLSFLSRGVYYLKIQNNDIYKALKIVKQ